MNPQQYRLEDLARLVQGECVGQADLILKGLASLDSAESRHLAFVNGEKYLEQALQSKAGAFIVTADLKDLLVEHQNFIVVANPYLAFAILTHTFEVKHTEQGIESTAQIHPSAIISDTAYIGHYVVIGANCVVGDDTIIHSHVSIHDGVEIGRGGLIESHVNLMSCKIGDRVRIHANTVIGSEGFGFAPYQGKWHRIAQLGSVIIGNDVRIGSNCSIDRGALDDTIAGHLNIVDNVTLTGMSMVTNNISVAGTYSSGIGLFENQKWKRTVVRLRQLADVPLTQLVKKLDHMQAQIESLESTIKLRK